ncbi:unnamed protein product, partial [Staurois parvus]
QGRTDNSWGPRAIGDHGAPVSLPKLKKGFFEFGQGHRGPHDPLLPGGPMSCQSAPGPTISCWSLPLLVYIKKKNKNKSQYLYHHW